MKRNILDIWRLTAEDLTELVDDNPIIRNRVTRLVVI